MIAEEHDLQQREVQLGEYLTVLSLVMTASSAVLAAKPADRSLDSA